MMNLDQDSMIGVARKTLNMEITGKEDWCLSWLRWFWLQEIEVAIYEAKQSVPDYAPAHADPLS